MYAKAQSIGIKISEDDIQKPNTYIFTENDVSFINIEKVFLELLEYKNEKKYFNISISKQNLAKFYKNSDWYIIEAPTLFFQITTFSDFEKIEKIFIQLLKKYLDSFYQYNKNFWEKDFMEYKEISENDANFIDEYNISIEQKQENNDLIEKVKNLAQNLSNAKENNFLPENLELENFKSFYSQSHLYNPLLFKNGKKKNIKISPIELNKGEIEFVKDLETYLETNKSKTGIGFFEEGGFYPDFILWVLKDKKQYITFIDPKGIMQLNPKTDSKINFYKKIKEKQEILKDDKIILNSFIISNTKFSQYKNKWDKNNDNFKQEVEDKNVLFQEDKDKPSYIKKLFDGIFSISD